MRRKSWSFAEIRARQSTNFYWLHLFHASKCLMRQRERRHHRFEIILHHQPSRGSIATYLFHSTGLRIKPFQVSGLSIEGLILLVLMLTFHHGREGTRLGPLWRRLYKSSIYLHMCFNFYLYVAPAHLRLLHTYSKWEDQNKWAQTRASPVSGLWRDCLWGLVHAYLALLSFYTLLTSSVGWLAASYSWTNPWTYFHPQIQQCWAPTRHAIRPPSSTAPKVPFILTRCSRGAIYRENVNSALWNWATQWLHRIYFVDE